MKEIEIVDFSEKEFSEIPAQDNPALIYTCRDNVKKIRCLMIVKANERHQVGNPGFSVLDIYNPENEFDGVLSLGVFYEKKNALMFAENYAREASQKAMEVLK